MSLLCHSYLLVLYCQTGTASVSSIRILFGKAHFLDDLNWNENEQQPLSDFILLCFHCSFHNRGCVCSSENSPSSRPGQTSQYRGLSLFFLNCLERARLKPAEPWAQGKYGPVALPTHKLPDTHTRTHSLTCTCN